MRNDVACKRLTIKENLMDTLADAWIYLQTVI